jgi:hypothetical protein
MKEKNAFKIIFLTLREILAKRSTGAIKEINEILLYANQEGTYFTAEFDKNEFKFHFRGTYEDFDEIEIGEREELLILDAFEDLYEELYKEQNEEEIRYEKVVDKLFLKFLKRRKITPLKEISTKPKIRSITYLR